MLTGWPEETCGTVLEEGRFADEGDRANSPRVDPRVQLWLPSFVVSFLHATRQWFQPIADVTAQPFISEPLPLGGLDTAGAPPGLAAAARAASSPSPSPAPGGAASGTPPGKRGRLPSLEAASPRWQGPSSSLRLPSENKRKQSRARKTGLQALMLAAENKRRGASGAPSSPVGSPDTLPGRVPGSPGPPAPPRSLPGGVPGSPVPVLKVAWGTDGSAAAEDAPSRVPGYHLMQHRRRIADVIGALESIDLA